MTPSSPSRANSDPSAPFVSQRVRAISMSATKEMPLLASRISGCVSLGQGVPSFATPPFVVDAVCLALHDHPGSGKYSLQPGTLDLRQAVAEMLKREKGLTLNPETEIGITVGAMEGLLAAILTLVDQNDEVIIPSPAYASHIEQVLLAEGVPVFVPLCPDDWSLDLDLVKSKISSKTKALILCNPGNPTGAVFPEYVVRELCALASQHGFFIISDETYDYLLYDGAIALSPATLPEIRERVVMINSFSKRFAMTGWRVGYMAAAPKLMKEMLKVHDAAAICAPMPSQIAALAAIQGPQNVVDDMCREMTQRRDLCCRRLSALSQAFSFVRPKGAFYIMARYLFSDDSSRDVAIRILEQAKVITIPGSSFGPTGEGYLRLSFGGEPAEINEAFDRIEHWLKTHYLV